MWSFYDGSDRIPSLKFNFSVKKVLQNYTRGAKVTWSCDIIFLKVDHHHCSDQAGLGQRGFNGTRSETRHQIDVNMKRY